MRSTLFPLAATLATQQLCLITFLVTHLTLNIGISLVDAGLMLAAAQAGGVVARVAWGVIADRWGRPMRLLGLVAIAMGAAAVSTGQCKPQWPRRARPGMPLADHSSLPTPASCLARQRSRCSSGGA